MCQTADRGWCGVFGAGLRDQEFATAAVISVAPDSAVETLAVLPQHVERGALSGARQPRVGHLASRRDPSRLDNRVDRYLGIRGSQALALSTRLAPTVAPPRHTPRLELRSRRAIVHCE